MKAYRWLTLISGAMIAVLEVLVPAGATGAATTAPPAMCDMCLGVVIHGESALPYATAEPMTPIVPRSDEALITTDDTPFLAIVTASWRPEASARPHLSLAGLGSLYWGATHPVLAWKVLAPLQSGDSAYADVRASCAASAIALTSGAACP